MPLYKNDSPILEYDDAQRAVIVPDHEKLVSLPERAVFAFLGDEVERFALKHHLPVISRFQTGPLKKSRGTAICRTGIDIIRKILACTE